MSAESSQLVTCAVADGVATLVLNRPGRHNSLVPPLLHALIAAIDEAESSDARAIVLRANGTSFSTGGDLRGFLDHRATIGSYASELVGLLNDAMYRLIESPLPVIVVVDGQVTGGSMGLVLAGDEVVVTEHASFTPYYSEVGFSPDGGWRALLPELIGTTRVDSVIDENITITAEQAVDCGLATAAASRDTLDGAVAEALARKLAVDRPDRKRQIAADYRERLEAERRRFVEVIDRPETLDHVESFLERITGGAA